jgi:hypothetical protein
MMCIKNGSSSEWASEREREREREERNISEKKLVQIFVGCMSIGE